MKKYTAIQIKSWLLKAIRIRENLIRMQCSLKPEAAKDCHDIKILLQYNSYNLRQLCAFVIRHQAKIQNFMPGRGSGAHETFFNEFQNILNYAQQNQSQHAKA